MAIILVGDIVIHNLDITKSNHRLVSFELVILVIEKV